MTFLNNTASMKYFSSRKKWLVEMKVIVKKEYDDRVSMLQKIIRLILTKMRITGNSAHLCMYLGQ